MYGEIEVFYGPMFSGKTSSLIRKIKRYCHAQEKCIVIKYKGDTRYEVQDISTHDKQTYKAIPCETLEIMNIFEDCDVIGIDEGQFFDNIVEFSEHYANRGKKVIISALDSTFERKPFGNILELVSKAEKVHKLTAICVKCHKEASFTKRLGNEKEVKLIGGDEKYMPVCRKCYFE